MRQVAANTSFVERALLSQHALLDVVDWRGV